MPRTSAKIRKRRKATKRPLIPLDRFSEKRPRGRPARIPARWVTGRAKNYRDVLAQLWDRVGPRLANAKTRDDVLDSFRQNEIGAYALEFARIADLILEVLQDPDFPKRQPQAQINFLADSLGGQGVVKPRSARDICARERAKEQGASHIIRYEYWIECSCGYKGRSLNHACPKCEAAIPLADLEGSALFQALNT